MQISINDLIISIIPAISSQKISKGMMGKKFNSQDQGMLFFMNNGRHYFWMKNCIIPLDIIFINNNTINKIYHNCQPCESENCEHYEGIGNFVLELPGGYCKKKGISEGDVLTIKF